LHHLPVFPFLTRLKIRTSLHEIIFSGHFEDNGKSILLIANHISWWDGFWVMALNMSHFHRKMEFMMLEENLQKSPILKQVGAFSIKRKSPSSIKSLHYSIKLLEHPENLVLIFPQGIIHSNYQTDIHFERGIYYIMERINGETQVVFVANLIDYFSNKKPNLTIYFKTYLAHQFKMLDIQKEYNRFHQQAVNKQK
jgi:1-acyl-sn-glycerol-3-phosphate acyltransferase